MTSTAMPDEFTPTSGLQSTMPNGAGNSGELADSARLEWLWSEYERQIDEIKQYQEEGMDIYPTPGFVLKTLLLSIPTRASPQFPVLTPSQEASKCKVFINICSDPSIELPSIIHDQQGGEQLRIPISVGPFNLDKEKDGETDCLTCDVVLNPDSITKASKEKEFRIFLSGFVLQKLEEKYKLRLDGSSLKFPKMKYKGSTPAPQHIRRPKGAHVETIRDEEEESKNGNTPEAIEERRKAASLARIEALRALEERESGIQMSKSNAATASSSSAHDSEVFLSAEHAEAAAAAKQASLAFDSNPYGSSSKKKESKIEVLSTEDAIATPASKPSADATSTVTTAVPPPPPSSSLPTYTLSYLKSLDSSIRVPPSEWDLDLALPSIVLLTIDLPYVQAGAKEVDVEIETNGRIVLQTKQEWKEKHQYQLFVRQHPRDNRVQLPFLLDDTLSECKFSKKTHTMTLTLPIVGLRTITEEEVEQVDGSKNGTRQATIDWQQELGLTNTEMWRHVAIQE